VRPEELAAGRIDHALFITVPCAGDGGSVPPATTGGAACDDGRDTPVLGSRLQLDMSAAEIDALGAPPWKRALLRAMARYGLIVGDTGGPAGWALQLQSDTSYTAMHQPPRLLAFARQAGWRRDHDRHTGRRVYLGDLGEGVDWARLRVVDPCVSEGSCG
jgi:hypothetical protein